MERCNIKVQFSCDKILKKNLLFCNFRSIASKIKNQAQALWACTWPLQGWVKALAI